MIPTQLSIFVCVEPIDMRLGFDRLLQLVRERVGRDARDGGLFAFVNRGKTRLKLLWFEQNGVCVLYKRLHRATFLVPVGDGASIRIDGQQLAALLSGSARSDRETKVLRRCRSAERSPRRDA